MDKQKYVSDIIGEEYKNWEDGDIIFIKTPTGSGKTTFILNTLLEYAVSINERILYIANREILKKQIEKKLMMEIRYNFPNVNNIEDKFMVMTYQEIENRHKKSIENSENLILDCKYIVCDECHYFLNDSTFNTNTEFSYDIIKKSNKDSILIYMSATIDNIKDIIYEREGIKDKEIESNCEPSRGMKIRLVKQTKTPKIYSSDIDYSYVKLHILKDVAKIYELINENRGKWLIFVDSKKNGTGINKSLLKKDIDTIFIDAELKSSDREAKKATEHIEKYEAFSQDVVICTSVMDNGITISDIEVRNVIIMAYTQEEFIQMLGRVRMNIDRIDDEHSILNLYILTRNKNFFKKKLKNIERIIENIGKYKKYTYRLKEIEEILGCMNSLKGKIPIMDDDYADKFDRKYIVKQYNSKRKSDDILKKILTSNNFYEFVKHTCSVVDTNTLVLNEFSDRQYKYLYDSYKNIIERFEKEGECAFVYQQAEWLGIENVDPTIQESKVSEKSEIISIIDEYVGEKLDKEKNIELRERIRTLVKNILQKNNQKQTGEIRKLSNEMIKKGDGKEQRVLSYERFNLIMDTLNLKYKMEKNGAYFIISKKE